MLITRFKLIRRQKFIENIFRQTLSNGRQSLKISSRFSKQSSPDYFLPIMTAQPSQLTTDNATGVKPETEKTNDALTPVDLDDYDINAGEDDLGMSLEDEIANKKLAARRKIEMYWEKKRLQEQLGDLEEIDFDF